MSYIRTKDNVYEVYAREKCPNGCVITTSGVRVPYTDILRESDTIEKLCDHLVVIEKESSSFPHIQHRFLGDLFIDHSYDEKFQQNKLIVYGAIWTDKGLIYVARMNKKGDWELL